MPGCAPTHLCIATLYTSEIASLAERTNPSKFAYCQRWGYVFECHAGTLDPSRPPAWSKLRIVRNLLDRYQWVFWLDADALIMNPEVRAETLLDDRYNLILAKQPGPDPWGNHHLNTGSFFIKSDKWSKRLLDDWYDQIQFIDHPGWEQEAFLHLYRQRDDVHYPINVHHWWGYMNRRGDMIMYPSFEWVDYLYDGLARATLDGRTGFIDGVGNWQIAPEYVYADRFEGNHAIVGNGEKFGFINKAGNLITPIQLDGALRFRENVAAVQVGRRCGFIDVRGEVVVPLNYLRVRSFHDGRAVAQLPDEIEGPGAIGYINKRGDWLFLDRTGHVTDLGDFHDNFARARVGRKWGYLDKRYKLVIEPRFEDARDFTNGVAAVKLEGKWGFIDKRGAFVIEPRLDFADDLDDTYAMVAIEKRVGFINRVGNQGIEAQFEWAEPYFHSLARVSRDDSFGYIDVAGRVIWDPRDAQQAIRDLTRAGHARALVDPDFGDLPGTRLVAVPPPRDPSPVPYEPEYRYEEQLPRKAPAF